MGTGRIININDIVLQLEKNIANGIPTLDSNTKIPKTQISLTASDVGALSSELDPTVPVFAKGLGSVTDVLTAIKTVDGTGSGLDSDLFRGLTPAQVVGANESATALKLTTPRTIATTGDATYSVSFDGSANVSAALTLATVNGNAGSFGSSSLIPSITINTKGQVTAASTNSIGNELIAFQALADTAGFIRKTGDGTYSIDPNSYLNLSGGTLTGAFTCSDSTPSTSPTTGAFVITGGGQGIGGSLYVGGNISGNGSLISNINASNINSGSLGYLRFNPVLSTPPVNDGAITDATLCNMSISSANGYPLTGNLFSSIVHSGRGLQIANTTDGLVLMHRSRHTSFPTGWSPWYRILTNATPVTGWTAATGVATRTTFVTSTVTLPQLAERVKALIDDLTTHGLIGT